MRKDNRITEDNPHEAYNNHAEPVQQSGEPMAGSKQVKQVNHSRNVKTREG